MFYTLGLNIFLVYGQLTKFEFFKQNSFVVWVKWQYKILWMLDPAGESYTKNISKGIYRDGPWVQLASTQCKFH